MNKLARYIIIAVVAAVIIFLFWYFRSVLSYILIAAVLAMISKPLMRCLKKIHFGKCTMPSWAAALISLITIFGALFSIFLLITPFIGEIISKVGSLDINRIGVFMEGPLKEFNDFLVNTFPALGDSFKIEMHLLSYFQEKVSLSSITTAISSVASTVIDLGVGLFSIIFISFFFLNDDGLFLRMILAIVPDKYEDKIKRANDSIGNLISRYFLGITIESLLIATINTTALFLIVKMPFSLALVIGMITGVLNIIPYVGPFAGDLLAVLMGLVMHYANGGVETPILLYIILILGICIVTQFIDNYIFQPYIYSNSVKAHPLEIFIVILMAAHIGGVIGMLIAIPAYTALRVMAKEFLSHFKIVQKLTRNIKEAPSPQDDAVE